jgi:hypothetical protein
VVKHMSGATWCRIHLWLVVAWTLLIVPTLLWWRESILWIAFMSLYANISGHFAAYQAARSERAIEE